MQEVRRNEFKDLLEMNELMFVEHTDFVKVDIPELGACTYYPKKNRLNIHRGNKWESDGYYFVKNHLNSKKEDKKPLTSQEYGREVAFDNIEQGLLELIGEYLDSESVIIEETSNNIKDPVSREKTELHVRMAKAAMVEYKNTIVTT